MWGLFCCICILFVVVVVLKILFIYFREREKEGEREGEKHLLVASYRHTDWGLNPGMCPDSELNQQPFTL